MNAAQRFAYERIPSFRREDGGLYALYSRIMSSIYARRARSRHDKGLHGPVVSINGRCEWCGRNA